MDEKLYSPLEFYLRDNDMLEYYDENQYWRDDLPPDEAVEFMDEIELALRRDRDTLDKDRGMMEYYYSGSVNDKVESLFPAVEVHDGKPWCVADMKLNEPLTAEEMAELKDWWSGQLSDGWGEGFEQHEIKVDRGELYMVPWTSDDSFFVDTSREFAQQLGLEPPARTEADVPARASTAEKPSVLAQIRDAAKEAKANPIADKDTPTPKKQGPEL